MMKTPLRKGTIMRDIMDNLRRDAVQLRRWTSTFNENLVFLVIAVAFMPLFFALTWVMDLLESPSPPFMLLGYTLLLSLFTLMAALAFIALATEPENSRDGTPSVQ